MYIRSAACISPFFPLEEDAAGLQGIVDGINHTTSVATAEPGAMRKKAVEPDYSRYVDPKMIRRMSRIVKMGVSAAMRCLQSAGSPEPGALITGTAYGCLEDTDIFLRRMIDNREELLSPTAFIQSTHNTVGAQIALLLKCHAYNNTIVHRGFSLEHALTEAGMLLAEETGPVLVGAIDELTDDSFALLSRFDLFGTPVANGKNRKFPAGEGAAFFLLGKDPSGKDLARIDHVATHTGEEMTDEDFCRWIQSEAAKNGIDLAGTRLIFDGSNRPLQDAGPVFGERSKMVEYKKLSGDFPTAAGVALWLAAELCHGNSPAQVKQKMLVLNRSAGHHSIIFVSSC